MPAASYHGETVEDFRRRLIAAEKRCKKPYEIPVVTISAPVARKLLDAYDKKKP